MADRPTSRPPCTRTPPRVDELRAEGIYQILTPDECVAEAKTAGDGASFNLHPLCGGMPIDEGWDSVHLHVDKVLPNV